MSWRVTVRLGGRVKRLQAPSLDAAVALAAEQAAALAARAPAPAVQGLSRRYEPGELVAARIEVRGPQRLRPDVHAGIDVRGDGSLQLWANGLRREPVEPESGEDTVDALRRAVRLTG